MKRVLIFGADGILGTHMYLGLRDKFELGVTFDHDASEFPTGLYGKARPFPRINAADQMAVARTIDDFRPDWVVNAIGLVKRPLAGDRVASLEANVLFPHLLAALCEVREIGLLHFSTDCVFSGEQGRYTETSVPDNFDWHGRCKALGEPSGRKILVLRTSFIGLELKCKKSLLEWFLAQEGRIPGYSRAIWSGFSGQELARLVERVLLREIPLEGLWHAAMPAISKFDLLYRLNCRLARSGCLVYPDESFICDRSLDGSAFAAAIGYVTPAWDTLIDEIAEDVASRWRRDAPSFWRC